MAADVNNSYLVEKVIDYAKLSLLAYADWKLSGSTWILDAYDENGNLKKGYQEYKDIWNELIKPAKGYSVVDFCPNDSTTGFSATLFQKDSKNILAIRGTTLTDLLDLAADAELATFQMPSGQFESMVQWITTKNLSSFDVTGHSLGGFLAQAAKASFAGSVGDVYTYNAPGALLRRTWDVRSACGFTETWDEKDMSLSCVAILNVPDNLPNKYMPWRV